MARKKKKIKPPKKKKKFLKLNLSPEAQKSIWGTIILFVAVFFMLSIFGWGGSAGEGLYGAIISFFGVGGAWVIIILLLLQASVLFFSERSYPYASTALGGFLFLFSAFGILDLIKRDLGGALGRAFSYIPRNIFGVAGSFAFFVAVFLIPISRVRFSP